MVHRRFLRRAGFRGRKPSGSYRERVFKPGVEQNLWANMMNNFPASETNFLKHLSAVHVPQPPLGRRNRSGRFSQENDVPSGTKLTSARSGIQWAFENADAG